MSMRAEIPNEDGRAPFGKPNGRSSGPGTYGRPLRLLDQCAGRRPPPRVCNMLVMNSSLPRLSNGM